MWNEVRTPGSRKVRGAFPSALSKGGGCAFFITVLWVISWFIKIDLKQIYCSCSRNKKIENGFQPFLLLFLRSIFLLNKNKNIGNDLLVFYKFFFAQLYTAPHTLLLFWRAWKEARVKKKHCCQQSANFETSVPCKLRKCAVPLESSPESLQ